MRSDAPQKDVRRPCWPRFEPGKTRDPLATTPPTLQNIVQPEKRFLFEFSKLFFYGKGIFSNPLHIKIQYSAVISPPPALISHCDQEKYTLTYYIEFS